MLRSLWYALAGFLNTALGYEEEEDFRRPPDGWLDSSYEVKMERRFYSNRKWHRSVLGDELRKRRAKREEDHSRPTHDDIV